MTPAINVVVVPDALEMMAVTSLEGKLSFPLWSNAEARKLYVAPETRF